MKYTKPQLVQDFLNIQMRLFIDEVDLPEKDRQKVVSKITDIFRIINLDK